MIKVLDCVALAADLPDHELAVGNVGAVVHVYEGGHSFQVEFTTFGGRTVAVAKVSANQVPPLGDKEIHHVCAFESRQPAERRCLKQKRSWQARQNCGIFAP
jgi:hypothetical protein